MRQLFALVTVSALLVPLGSEALEACGAKFLVAVRSAQRQRMQHTRQPGNILLYQHSNSREVVEETTALRDLLNSVGHTAVIAPGEAALRDAGRTGRFDLVMMELSQARSLKSSVQSSLPGAKILPVAVLEETRVRDAAKKEFGRVLKAPARANETLEVVASALK